MNQNLSLKNRPVINSRPVPKKKGADSLIDLFCFLRKHRNKVITIVLNSDCLPCVGFYEKEKFVEIPHINDLYFELESYHRILTKIKNWGFPVSAIAEKLAAENFFEN